MASRPENIMTAPHTTDVASPGSRDAIATWLLPALTLALQLATYAGYGYFRDELYYLANGEHLGFGYVEHPPLIGFIAALVRATLGDSLFAIRLLPAFAAAATVFLAGAIARELGGGRFAQLLAGLSAMLVPAMLGVFGVFTMNAFDILAWAALWWLVTRYLATGQDRLWLTFGIVAGIGLENKISVLFLGFGIVAGLVVCRRWGAFRSRWLWIGGASAGLLFLPHVLWQAANGWPTLEFMRNAIAEKNVAFSPMGYVAAQLLDTFPALPVWLAGLVFLIVARSARPFRPLGWAYLAILGVMLTTNSKPEYLVPAYSVLFAAGGVALEQWRPGGVGTVVRAVVVVFLIGSGVALAPFAKAILPVDAFVRYAHTIGVEPPQGERQTLGRLPQHFADMHGWPELAEAVDRVYRGLPPADRAKACIFAHNYGQAGAIDLFGRRLGLPKAIAGHNSYFLWGPRGCTGEVMIVIGGSRDELRSSFASVDLGATFTCTDCMPYENNKPIWVARGLKEPMSTVWPRVKRYI
jgi:hypothetical protein